MCGFDARSRVISQRAGAVIRIAHGDGHICACARRRRAEPARHGPAGSRAQADHGWMGHRAHRRTPSSMMKTSSSAPSTSTLRGQTPTSPRCGPGSPQSGKTGFRAARDRGQLARRQLAVDRRQIPQPRLVRRTLASALGARLARRSLRRRHDGRVSCCPPASCCPAGAASRSSGAYHEMAVVDWEID
jgi:hypothetical protein